MAKEAAKEALAKKGKAGWKAVKGMKKAPGAAGEGDAAGEAEGEAEAEEVAQAGSGAPADGVSTLSPEQQATVLELHMLVDDDKDGGIDKDEFEAAIGDKNGKFFPKLDADSNGKVSPEELLGYMEKMCAERGPAAVDGLLGSMRRGVEKLQKKRGEAAAAAAAEAAADMVVEKQEQEASVELSR